MFCVPFVDCRAARSNELVAVVVVLTDAESRRLSSRRFTQTTLSSDDDEGPDPAAATDELQPQHRFVRQSRPDTAVLPNAVDQNEALPNSIRGELGVNDSSEHSVRPISSDELVATSDGANDRRYISQGLLVKEEENKTTDELTPIKQAEVMQTTTEDDTNDDTEDMVSAQSSFVIDNMDSDRDDIEQYQSAVNIH